VKTFGGQELRIFESYRSVEKDETKQKKELKYDKPTHKAAHLQTSQA
jgi:hypothetical protein